MPSVRIRRDVCASAGVLLTLALEAAYATAFRAAGLSANLVLKRVLGLRCIEPVSIGRVVEIRGREVHRARAQVVVGLRGTPLPDRHKPWMDSLMQFVQVDEEVHGGSRRQGREHDRAHAARADGRPARQSGYLHVGECRLDPLANGHFFRARSQPNRAAHVAAEHLARLRQRALSGKRSLAIREFALGVESLERFVRKEPLRRVHECVFGVLALESEPVDPRL